MRLPGPQNPPIDLCRCSRRLRSEGVLMVVSVFHRRSPEMNHGIVAGDLFGDRAGHRGPEFLDGSWPVRKAIKGSTVAQHNRGIVTIRRVLQLALNIENRPLRGTYAEDVILPWK